MKNKAMEHEQEENNNNKDISSEKIRDASTIAEHALHACAMYDFVSKMRIYHEEAMSSPEYLRDCYEGAFMIQNMGFMTLVSPRYFPFATKLLTLLHSVFTQNSFEEKGDKVLSSGREKVQLELQPVREAFLDSGKDDIATEDNLVGEEEKIKVFNFIVDKTVNCWFASQLKQYRSNNTGRAGNVHVKNDFRKDLASKCKGLERAD